MSNVRNIKLTTVDDLFKTDIGREDEMREKVVEVALSDISDFPNHPFKVKQDEAMSEMAESVKKYGILHPALVRPKEGGGYELIAGHRRKLACVLAGVENMPVIVRNMSDDEAVIVMVDSNCQREHLLPSEKAFAYKMKLDAISRQGERNDLTSCQVGTKLESKRSNSIVAENSLDSARNIHRFIRLTELVTPLLDMVDEKKIAFNPAVELSYLPEELQTELYDSIEANESTPSLSQAQRLKTAAQSGKLDRNGIDLVLSEEKPQQNNLTIKSAMLDKYIPKDYTPKQQEEFIVKALDYYCRRLERLKQERQQER